MGATAITASSPITRKAGAMPRITRSGPVHGYGIAQRIQNASEDVICSLTFESRNQRANLISARLPIRAGAARSLLAKCCNRIQSCGTLRGKPHGNERHSRKQQCDRREDCWIAWSHAEQKA